MEEAEQMLWQKPTVRVLACRTPPPPPKREAVNQITEQRRDSCSSRRDRLNRIKAETNRQQHHQHAAKLQQENDLSNSNKPLISSAVSKTKATGLATNSIF